MMTDDEIEAVLNSHCLLHGFRKLPRGHYRADTKLLYPDGAAISVFVERGDLASAGGCVISDFGNTLAKLAEYQVDARAASRFQTIKDSVGSLGVRVQNDRLVLELSGKDQIADGIITLSQACLRAACLIFTRRASQQRPFTDEVKSVVESTQLPFEEKYRFDLPQLRPITVDYRVTNPSRTSSILTLGTSHAQANEVFRKWYDLQRSGVEDRMVTIFDDRRELERQEDLIRLEDISKVVSLSNQNNLAMLLKAA